MSRCHSNVTGYSIASVRLYPARFDGPDAVPHDDGVFRAGNAAIFLLGWFGGFNLRQGLSHSFSFRYTISGRGGNFTGL
jgi:hypothetical protein